MPRDYDAERAEPGRWQAWRTGWRLWVTSPSHLLVAASGTAALGLLLGYLITVVFIFPPQNVAADLTRVPSLIGRTADEARQRVERRGLEYEEAMGMFHSRPVGTVVAQEPLPDQMAQPGSAVRVTLSLGPPQRPVPDVVGLSHEQAEVVLEQAGLEVEITRVDASADVGEVVGTRPRPGTPLELPASVRILVSAGQSAVTVPDLVMRSLAEAEATLGRLGLRLGEVADDSAGLAAPGTVIAQSPAAGDEVARGTRVSVTVAVAPPPAVDTNPVPADTGAARTDTAAAGADASTNQEVG